MLINTETWRKTIAGELTEEERLRVVAQHLQTKNALAAYFVDEGGDLVLYVIFPSEDDKDRIWDTGKSPQDYIGEVNIREWVEDFEAGKNLGELSKLYEVGKNGGPATVSKPSDDPGGISYGTYQIASETGTMANFLGFLKSVRPAYFKELATAGGVPAAKDHTSEFPMTWISLERDNRPDFGEIQHAFIQLSHYNPFVGKLRKAPTNGGLNFDLNSRTITLRNVGWSVAVQHGPANNVFYNALKDQDLSDDGLDDKEIIERVYGERSKVEKYFSKAPKLHDELKGRFDDEKSEALDMLKKELAAAGTAQPEPALNTSAEETTAKETATDGAASEETATDNTSGTEANGETPTEGTDSTNDADINPTT